MKLTEFSLAIKEHPSIAGINLINIKRSIEVHLKDPSPTKVNGE